MDDRELADVVRGAAAGDQQAWNQLVDRFSNLLWSITSAYRLSQADAADVLQTTWLRLLEHLDSVREPERVGSWLATTARRECLRVLRRTSRVLPTDDDLRLSPEPDPTPDPEAALLQAERHQQLREALALLPEHSQRLLRIAASGASYEEIAAALGMPIGSIGPTRARCLERLRRHLVAAGAAPSPSMGAARGCVPVREGSESLAMAGVSQRVA
jgi:RNA polymerase sigma factor (sigma-70 family)